jgi:hypothetical protein
MFESGVDTERAFEDDALMSRTRVRRGRWSIVAVFGLAAALAGPVTGAVSGAMGRPTTGDLRPVAQQRYVVASGDTLWGIARQVAPGRDPRPIVDAIARRNHLAPGDLSAGQSLTIPPIG